MTTPGTRHSAFRPRLLAFIFAVLASAQTAFAAHPLDPLDSDEIVAAVSILRDAGKVSSATRYPTIKLLEPSKAEVLDSRGGPARRRAFLVVYQNNSVAEAVVDIAKRKLVSWTDKPGVQSQILLEEFFLARDIVLSSPEFRAALARRGYTNYDSLFFMPLSAGNYGDPQEAGRRMLRTTAIDLAGTMNPWAHPLENLHADIDLQQRTVIRVVDTGVVITPKVNSDYPVNTGRAADKRLIVSQPDGVGFSVDGGHQVKWDRWNFHFRVEQREGLIISLARYNDAGRERSVLYQASLAETFVPYGDPTSNWYYRTYMDEGEYGIGKNVQPLIPGQDCPENAVFFDVTLADDFGGSFTVPNGVAIFERTPHLLWKHFDILSATQDGRAGRELVVRFASIVGNYDYFFDWIFSQDGSISMRVGAGGVMEMKGVQSTSVGNRSADTENQYGTLVDTNVNAPFHQHIFNYRLDLDVDGTKNVFSEIKPTVVPVNDSRRKSAVVVETQMFDDELEARRQNSNAIWTVLNPDIKNRLGYSVGYSLEVHGEGDLLMTPDDPAARRAGFAEFPLWVTPHSPTELYPAGDYPNQSAGGEGLPLWTSANRDIRNKDIVLWVNVAMTHISRSEDYPLMPTEWFGGIEIRPFNFFDRNPAIDLPSVP